MSETHTIEDFGKRIQRCYGCYIAFFMKVPGPGEFDFVWEDDAGAKVTEKLKLNVS